jgi:hypothetical protein
MLFILKLDYSALYRARRIVHLSWQCVLLYLHKLEHLTSDFTTFKISHHSYLLNA